MIQQKQQNITNTQKEIQKMKADHFKSIKNDQLFINCDSEFKQYNIKYMKACMLQDEQLSKFDLLELIGKFKNIIKNQPNLIRINGDAMVIGDLHGQFYDFVKILSIVGATYGDGDVETFCQKQQLLFLGDYVDRGLLSTEILSIIMALKVNYPATVTCLRGNHECRTMTAVYNFKSQVLVKYDQQVYDYFIEVFDFLPLAALINNVYFCVHGGISDQLNKIDKINNMNRVREIPDQGPFCDFMWADPMPKLNQEYFPDVLFNNTRMCSIFFGRDLTQRFATQNKLKSIIRAHEVYPQGFQRKQWGSKNKTTPSVVTVFSAPNYCGIYGNLGAILHIKKDNNFQIRQYREQPINKFKFHTFVEVISWSMPKVIQVINQFTKGMMNTIGKLYLKDFDKFQSTSNQQRLNFLLGYWKFILGNNDPKPIQSQLIKVTSKDEKNFQTTQKIQKIEQENSDTKISTIRSKSSNQSQRPSILEPLKRKSDIVLIKRQ